MRVNFAAGAGTRDFTPAGIETLNRRCALLEEQGYELLCMGDSQSLFPDMYIQLALIALYSTKARIFPTVTNPVTRHPAVAANAAATVDAISGGRFVFNISSGDSAVRNLGLKPATQAEMREYVTAFKDLFRTKEATYHGKTIRLLWPEREVPVYITAEGPKSLELAGELCDGVYVGVGIQPDAVQGALACIERGAKKSGRSLSDLDIWWYIRGNLVDDKEQGIHEARMALASCANHSFRFTLEGKYIPEEHKPAIRRLQKRYDSAHHQVVDGVNAEVLDEADPKLKYSLAERFAIIGPPEEYIRRIEMLADLGATQLNIVGVAATPEEQEAKMQRFADEMMPHFR